MTQAKKALEDVQPNKFTLASFKQAADAKFGRMEVDLGDGTSTFLSSPFRLGDETLARVIELVDSLKPDEDKEEDEEFSIDEIRTMAPALREFVTLVGDENTPRLLELIDGDLAVLLEIFTEYQEQVGLGEASPSSS